MELRLIVNPHASRVSAPVVRSVESALATRHRVRVSSTRGRDHATELAASALEQGDAAVVVLGGDGTLNEAANALVGTDGVLAALPGGSTNIFCRTQGLPDDAGRAALEVAVSLQRDHTVRIGVGELRADGAAPRVFLCHAGFGWDAALVEIVERHAPLKRHLGHAVFVAAGARTFLGGYDRSRPHLRVEVPGRAEVDDAFFALVMNRDPYTYVGTRPFVVDPDNGEGRGLTVAALRSLRVDRFVPLMAAALRGRGLSDTRWLTVLRDVSELGVERLSSVDLQVDGDHLGSVGHVRLQHRPAALEVVAPSGGVALSRAPDGRAPGRS